MYILILSIIWIRNENDNYRFISKFKYEIKTTIILDLFRNEVNSEYEIKRQFLCHYSSIFCKLIVFIFRCNLSFKYLIIQKLSKYKSKFFENL